MKSALIRFVLPAILVAGGGAIALAGLGAPGSGVGSKTELLVLEVEDCQVCGLVRRKIAPRYEETPHARTTPMRFVDITRRDETTLGLKAPVDTLPTIVLLRDGHEVDRISGYVGPDLFMTMVGHMLRGEGE